MIRIAMIGCGAIGASVLELLKKQADATSEGNGSGWTPRNY